MQVLTGNVDWMLAIVAATSAEKNLSWGRRLSAPLGLLLMGAAGVEVLAHVSAVIH